MRLDCSQPRRAKQHISPDWWTRLRGLGRYLRKVANIERSRVLPADAPDNARQRGHRAGAPIQPSAGYPDTPMASASHEKKIQGMIANLPEKTGKTLAQWIRIAAKAPVASDATVPPGSRRNTGSDTSRRDSW